MQCLPFSGSFPGATKPLECIHMDLCGPINPASRGGNCYFLKIIDGYIKYRFIFPMKLKSDTFQVFKSFLSQAETATSHKIVLVVSNNGGEFVNNKFRKFFDTRGIQHLTSAPYTPQQNPFAKRGNRTTVKRSRAMLATVGLPLSWWGEAVTTCVYLENWSPDSSINFLSPYKLWKGTPPDLSRLAPFGCRAVAYLKKSDCQSKFSPSRVEAVFLGYDEHHHTYKLFDSSALFDFSILEQNVVSDSLHSALIELPPSASPPVEPANDPKHCQPAPDHHQGSSTPEHCGSSPPSPPNATEDSSNPTLKGYVYVPHFDKAPKDISSSIDTSNIIDKPRRRRALVV
ncbi:hypothetical protein PCASD_02931 [Puccinia coronata f. sp. avenae]|uniref:Integrase catalytic domain-containing protein n=1 Tax=Puccinia coronata f. sp. avenae TaxID=200324 RepID=A0A2N5VEC6_9BASI|nr:hypothetical protein PCASD_02931 [Puccinia coronata f. sp. avenae]